MTLSINKLKSIIERKNLLIKKIFFMKGLCIYIEIFCLLTSDSFLLYIPSKYKIKVSDEIENYELDYIDVSEDGNIASDYGSKLEDYDIEKQYDSIDIDINSNSIDNMETFLEEKYNYPLSLKDMKISDLNEIREIFRQLRRLKLCVQNVKYKICIMYKNYICCIKRDDSFEGFFILGLNGPPSRKLIITLDLESLYKNLETVTQDVKLIREGIYRILNKNQLKNVSTLTNILEQKNNLQIFSVNIQNKKQKFEKYLLHLERLLSNLIDTENFHNSEILQINSKYDNDMNFNNDIQKSHEIGKHKKIISDINVIKQELMNTIIIIKSKLEDLSLKVDKICFDNTIMIDAINKNFKLLENI